jgi:glycosyltransferase involved in cell wall biosynthesis
MRVLIVSDTYGNMHGGVPEETRHLLNGLVSRGHEVALCSDAPLTGVDGVAHHPLTLPTTEALGHEVGRALAAHRPEVVHVMAMSSRGLTQLRNHLKGRPWLMTCHSLPPQERKLPLLHDSELLHYAARAVRFLPHALAWRSIFVCGLLPRVVVHSPRMARLVARYGQPVAAIDTILLGVDGRGPEPTVPDEPSPAAPQLITIAGIAHTKGHHDALRAIGLLHPRFPGIGYRIVGEIRDGSYMAYLRRLIERLQLADVVRVTPNLTQAEKQEALASSHLYLQPSHEEGFCLAYAEAARRVRRLVGTDTGAIALLSEGDPGARVVRVRDPAGLAAAMADLLSLPLPSDLMHARAERLRARFGWDRYLDAHESLYARVQREAPAAPT